MVSPVKVKLPEVSAVVLPATGPLKVTVAPLPPVPLMVPCRVYVCTELVKFTPLTAAVVTVTAWLEGLNW